MKPDKTLIEIQNLVKWVKASVFDQPIQFKICRDLKRPKTGRIFIQCEYTTTCVKTKEPKLWKGRKWYLSDYMTNDEVVKTCYAAFKATVEHEIMEGFKFNNQQVFNPHTPFTVLIEASKQEQFRS